MITIASFIVKKIFFLLEILYSVKKYDYQRVIICLNLFPERYLQRDYGKDTMETLTADDRQTILRFVDAIYSPQTSRQRNEALRKVYEYIVYCLTQYTEGEEYAPERMGRVEYWLSHFQK
jgi:hypothetical protein